MPIFQKRSLVAGVLPTTASLLAGELGINVPDGRVFLRKSGSGSDTIQSAITTGAQNSGSVVLSGSLTIFSTSGSALSVASDTLEFNGDQMEFTGSFSVSGSTTIIGRLTANDITGSLFGTASRAISSSVAISSSYALSSSYSTNGFPFSGSAVITGSLSVSGSVSVFNNEFSVQSTGVNLGNIITDAHTITGSFSVSGSINIDGGTY